MGCVCPQGHCMVWCYGSMLCSKAQMHAAAKKKSKIQPPKTATHARMELRRVSHMTRLTHTMKLRDKRGHWRGGSSVKWRTVKRKLRWRHCGGRTSESVLCAWRLHLRHCKWLWIAVLDISIFFFYYFFKNFSPLLYLNFIFSLIHFFLFDISAYRPTHWKQVLLYLVNLQWTHRDVCWHAINATAFYWLFLFFLNSTRSAMSFHINTHYFIWNVFRICLPATSSVIS